MASQDDPSYVMGSRSYSQVSGLWSLEFFCSSHGTFPPSQLRESSKHSSDSISNNNTVMVAAFIRAYHVPGTVPSTYIYLLI